MNDERGLIPCEGLKDADLIRETKFLAERSRHNEMRLLEHLAEFDARRLCLEEGHRSLYEYCTMVLGFEEAEAYRRIRVARVIRAFPEARHALEQRRVTASSLVVLSPWLERKNVGEWLSAAAGKSKREVEALVAARYPQAPQPDAVRNFPFHPLVMTMGAPPHAVGVDASGVVATGTDDPFVAAAGAPPHAVEAGEARVGPEVPRERLEDAWQQLAPIAAGRVRVGFDAACVIAQLLERVRQLLRHKYPEGRLEDIIREALESYLDRKDPQRRLERKLSKGEVTAKTPERPVERFPRDCAASRYIPAKVKSAVWARDDGSCAWRSPDGKVCGAKDWLEYDHIHPYAKGGRSDDPRNIRLLCRDHNQAASIAIFGPRPADAEISAGPAPA